MLAALLVWTVVTLGHVLLAVYWAGRMPPTATLTRDERLWRGALLAVGSLAAVLHAVAMTTGLSLASGTVGLIVWNALAAIALRRGGPVPAPPPPRLTPFEALASAVLFLIVVSWADVAGQYASIDGTDAAHYHVPNAINYALGAGPFDLPATQHLYPVGGSIVAAWFVVPLGTPLVIDLAMVPAFLLMLASVNWIFRQTTGLSGLAWASWLVVALAATPLVRMSSLVSGDLWFTAGYLALTASLVTAWTERTWSAGTVLLAALAAGLLIGAKTSGTPAAGLLVGTYLVAELSRSLLSRRWPTLPVRPLATSTVALALMLAAGGVWVVRNWIRFGSPLAPSGFSVFGVSIFPGDALQPTTYLSVLGDQQAIEGYDTAARAQRYAGLWLGRPFVMLLWPAVLVPLDLLVAAIVRRWSTEASARLIVAVLVGLPGLVLVYLLIGAPWTSLEWTRGFSLRYALPVIVGAALVSAIGILPLMAPWYRDRLAAGLVIATAAAVSGSALVESLQPGSPRFSPMPPADIAWLPAAAVLALACWWASGHRRRTWTVAIASVVVAAAIWAPPTVARTRAAIDRAWQQLAAEQAAGPRVDAHRVPLFAAIDAERAAGRACDARRFFVLSRFDLPLALETPDFRSQVFYAGRDVDLAARAGPLRACDYVVATPALMETDRGPQLLQALAGSSSVRRLVQTDQLVVFGP